MSMGRRFAALLGLILLLLVQSVWRVDAFESDELDDEWGLIGAGSSSAPPPAAPAAASVKRSDASSGAESSKVEFPLEHAFGSSEFKPAGSFVARLRPSSRGGQTMVKLRLTRLPFSDAEKLKFYELLKEDGYYTIRVPATPLKPGNATVMSSIKARCLASSNLKERFDFYMAQSNIISVGYSPGAECPYPREVKPVSKWVFDSHIFSKSGEEASRILIWNDEVAGEGNVDEALQLKKIPEKSFWAKYWMYIIPLGLIIMNAVTQVANMQDDQQQQQGGAGAAPGSLQAPAAASSRPAVRRR